MMTKNQSLWIFFGILLCLIAVLTACGCEKRQKKQEASPKVSSATERGSVQNAFHIGKTAPDLAWYFASSIDNDPEDRADYQAKVALARFHRDGDVKTALMLGYSINRWYRGLVLAEVAESLAQSGERKQALSLIRDALTIADKGVEQGWQADRIRSVLGRAEAVLRSQGDATDLHDLNAGAGDNIGTRIATETLEISRRESLTKAMDFLDGFSQTNSPTDISYKVSGYGLIAKEAAPVDPVLAARALDAIWACTTGVTDLQLSSARMDVVETALSYGLTEYARAKTDTLAETIQSMTAPAYILLPTKTRLAKVLAKTGNKATAAEFANSVIAGTAAVLNIEQPAILADAAAALYLADPNGDAEKHFLEAIRLATEIKNRRPRCKALCDITLSLHECGMNKEIILLSLEDEARKLKVEP